jgi:hypothetical protein
MVVMKNTGIMHIKTSLLNIIGKFRTSESKIFERTSEATVKSGIRKRFTIRRKFGGSINMGSRRLGFLHADARKEIKNVLALGEKQANISPSDINTQEVMKTTKASPGEFFAKERNYVFKEGGRRSSKNNIIDIDK